MVDGKTHLASAKRPIEFSTTLRQKALRLYFAGECPEVLYLRRESVGALARDASGLAVKLICETQ